MFGHLPEIFGLLVLGLIIFGPKRMIELGGQLGRSLRELQSAMKDMSWNPLGDDDTATSAPPTTLGKLSQLAQDWSAARSEDAAPATSSQVVETTATPTTPTTTATAAQPASDAPAE